MKREQDMSESELNQLSEIINRHLAQLWSDVQHKINQQAIAARTEIEESQLQLSDAEPANEQYFSAHVMDKLFDSLQEGNQVLAKTIIYNMKGRAGLLE